MADLPQQNTIVQYLADGVTDEYAVPFYTPLEPDGTPNLDVFTQDVDASPIPTDDINEWNVDYTYTPNLDPITGGTVTFLPGHIPANGYIVTIVRNVSASLDVEFSQAQTFSGFTLDAALDKLLLISQQNKSYALQRNLSYIINSYLPESEISANVQIPVLEDGQTWFGSANGVIAATLEQPADVSTLRSELANEQPVTNGASLVGFYDDLNSNPTTVADQLNYLTQIVLAAIPTGARLEWCGAENDIPAGFLFCDGSAISRVTYANLFAKIGTRWGAGNGTTTFNIPDSRRRVSMGAGGVGTAIIGNEIGDIGGAETEALTDEGQLADHAHNYNQTISVEADVSAGGIPIFSISATPESETSSAGEGDPFSIVQSAEIVGKIIRI